MHIPGLFAYKNDSIMMVNCTAVFTVVQVIQYNCSDPMILARDHVSSMFAQFMNYGQVQFITRLDC